jgi:hypothetical protein
MLSTIKPSLYMGESSRSLYERAREHWTDADKRVEECHMMEHQNASHRGEDGAPTFKFKLVKGFRTALERQLREAVRIQQRGQVLNKRGEFNRCKLTRMDVEWERKCWEKAWSKRDGLEVDEEDGMFLGQLSSFLTSKGGSLGLFSISHLHRNGILETQARIFLHWCPDLILTVYYKLL